MSAVSAAHESRFIIAATHPALPGHFPGAPVVPGVLVLDHVLAAAEAWLARPLHARSLAHCKFLATLMPEQEARVRLELDGSRLRFDVRHDARLLARGEFSLDPERIR